MGSKAHEDLCHFLDAKGQIFDVRSPSEYLRSTIPGAINLPLFSDEERAIVGTTYKKNSPLEAYLIGLDFAGKNLRHFVEVALQFSKAGPPKVFCARGGERSRSIAWLLGSAKLAPLTLPGGYKHFRQFVLETFKQPFKFHVIGGNTGSGKTEYLRDLENKGEQVIDLEGLANHRGSAFGGLGEDSAPSTELFENRIAMKLYRMDASKPIWIEDESRMIGRCKIPDALFAEMNKAPLHLLEIPFEERVERLKREYAHYPKASLIQAVLKLSKRLGKERTDEVVHLIEQEAFSSAIGVLLEYYDKRYAFSLTKRDVVR